ncbi:MAG: HDIG domain-containing protein [Ignavibacteria bacterium]|jgi:putative nucleotidyltransferase with HDIG domain|nr:HDIG domain-containing protein [Ignavibacteria bacterium]MCU7502035.1 HDIG domain-containing protein [Ignavibacteria bacterium]MCU7515437.1 HDIG domain-containing protein [Ignavibacteria bacterium]
MGFADKSVLRKSLRIKLLILFVTVVLIVMMFPGGESIESEVTVGSIWLHDDLIANNSFPIYKSPEQYKQEKRRAAQNVFPIFQKKENVLQQTLDSLSKYNEYLIGVIDRDLEGSQSEQDQVFLSPSSYKSFRILRQSESTFAAPNNQNLRYILSLTESIIKDVYKTDILNLLYNEIRKDSIAVRLGKFDKIETKVKFQDITRVRGEVAERASKLTGEPQLNNAVAEYIDHFIKPNLLYREDLTEQEVKLAENKVSPNIGIVNENERIIAKHDRISEEAKLKIDSYRRAKAEKLGFINSYTQLLGKFVHVLLILALFVIYLFLFRKKVYADNVKILLISIIILFISFVTFLVHQINVDSPVYLLIIIPAASMLLTIIFDSRVGFYGTVVISLIAGGLRGNDYSFVAMNIFAGALASYTVRDIKNRTQVFRSFVFILLGYSVSILAFGLERFDTINNIVLELVFAASNALVSPVFTFGMIIFFERLFRITTDLTLLELTDFNRPLLKDLARKAPGTFTHAMTVGSLVESAAEQIHANPLLARVGAYYHDIGKTKDPSNFVENQLNDENRHEHLDPRESARLIIDHVKQGIELARENNIPQEVMDFIPMHHGTLVVSFFYEKAKSLYGQENVDINNFRYKGPKPNSKETALVMLADACESTVRSIQNPDPVKVENVINSLIKNRIDDGQLDDSPITLSDLKKIKESFLSILLGQHHKRIRYPKQDEMENMKGI